MNIVVLTPVRLLGDALAACLNRRSDIAVCDVVSDLERLRHILTTNGVSLVLVDVTHGVDLFDVRSIATEYPDLSLVALGLTEQRREVIQCGRAGFTGYVPRDVTVDALCESLFDVARGRLKCPAEISGGLLRALFRRDPAIDAGCDPVLTRREMEVLQLIGRGLSNKEIATELCLSVTTVKHHVHKVLEKLSLSRRAQAMQRVRDAPWIVTLTQQRVTRDPVGS